MIDLLKNWISFYIPNIKNNNLNLTKTFLIFKYIFLSSYIINLDDPKWTNALLAKDIDKFKR